MKDALKDAAKVASIAAPEAKGTAKEFLKFAPSESMTQPLQAPSGIATAKASPSAAPQSIASPVTSSDYPDIQTDWYKDSRDKLQKIQNMLPTLQAPQNIIFEVADDNEIVKKICTRLWLRTGMRATFPRVY